MISIIAAVAAKNVIGNKNRIPWHIPEDFKHFKDITMGHPVLMGRNTFLSIMQMLGKPLPGRTNLVLAKEDFPVPEGVQIFHSLEDALEVYKDRELFVIGGASVYAQAIPFANTLYITHIDQSPEGDTYFPEIKKDEWKLVSEEPHEGHRFARYERIKR